MKNFDEGNLAKANQEIQDLIVVAQFNSLEKKQFLNKIRKELAAKNIGLDFLK